MLLTFLECNVVLANENQSGRSCRSFVRRVNIRMRQKSLQTDSDSKVSQLNVKGPLLTRLPDSLSKLGIHTGEAENFRQQLQGDPPSRLHSQLRKAGFENMHHIIAQEFEGLRYLELGDHQSGSEDTEFQPTPGLGRLSHCHQGTARRPLRGIMGLDLPKK